MRVRWRGFELPTRVSADSETLDSTFGQFTAEPFERGFGITVGNGLRRVLLSSLEGVAVTSVKIEGAQHEFSTLDGVYEEVTDIILNIKQLLVRMTSDEPKKISIDVRRKGPVTAADIVHDHTIEVVNKDQLIATLTEDVSFCCELEVQKGRGYCTADENAFAETEVGVIPIASFFSPVKRVRYRTENTRVGHLTNYDKLILEVWTDGTVTPEMALVEAGKILRKHLNPFVHYYDLGRELLPDTEDAIDDEETISVPVLTQEDLSEKLQRSVTELDLSIRAANCLESEDIQSIGDLCGRSEEELLKLRNFGKTTLKEIRKRLVEIGLDIGMDTQAILS